MNTTKRLLVRQEAAGVARIAVALGCALVTLTTIAASSEIAREPVYAAACNRNPGLSEYTFGMTVEMAMRHFPWLHFHLSGAGQYVRGETYTVQFTNMPFFAASFKKIDLAPLDPNMWRYLYNVRVAQRYNGWTAFVLRPRKNDPQDPNPLVQAFVTLDANYATRDVALHYKAGQIQLILSPSDAEGYRLPSSADVKIDMPGEALDAHAIFSDYKILRATLAGR